MRVWFDNLTKRDARLLADYWNAHHRDLFFVRVMRWPVYRRARYELVRQLEVAKQWQRHL